MNLNPYARLLNRRLERLAASPAVRNSIPGTSQKAALSTSTLNPYGRVHNFSAGPAAGSFDVMEKVHKEWMNYQGTGMGFVEISHRDVAGPVQNLMVETQDLVKELLNVPEGYSVLFMHGGAHLQFSGIPVNFCNRDGVHTGKVPQYIDTGFWAQRSAAVAYEYMKLNYKKAKVPETMEGIFASTERGFLKKEKKWKVKANADYVYFCANETIAGLEYKWDPDMALLGEKKANIPLICDATSTLMSRPMDISKYGCIFASSGKNLGPAGVTLVIVKDELMTKHAHSAELASLPIMDFMQQKISKPIENVYNTPPTFNIYMLNHMLQEYKAKGGLEVMEEKADSLSEKCYKFVDNSPKGFYTPIVDYKYRKDRSRMNVCFQIGGRVEDIGQDARDKNMALEKKFTHWAEERGVHQLMGHPIFGGLRITLYNPMPEASVDVALSALAEFAAEHQHFE